MKRTITEETIRRDYVDAPTAAARLGLDKSHVCAQLRAGRFPGAFQFGRAQNAPWLIPRVAVDAYQETHPSPHRHRRKAAPTAPEG